MHCRSTGLSFGVIRTVKLRFFCRVCFWEEFLWADALSSGREAGLLLCSRGQEGSSGFWATAGIEEEEEEMDVTEVSIIHHACIVLLGLWLLSEFNWCHPVAYFISLIYLYLVTSQFHPVSPWFYHLALLIRSLLHFSELPVLLKSGIPEHG